MAATGSRIHEGEGGAFSIPPLPPPPAMSAMSPMSVIPAVAGEGGGGVGDRTDEEVEEELRGRHPRRRRRRLPPPSSPSPSPAPSPAFSLSLPALGGTASDPSGRSLAATLVSDPAKVVKGEIHNVMAVMRSDARYASPLRFQSEMLPQGREEERPHHHPLLVSLRGLYDRLCRAPGGAGADADADAGADAAPSGEGLPQAPAPLLPDPTVYLGPFASAVSSRDVSAQVTGAALSAVHKFILYGFLTPPGAGPEGKIGEGITMVARCIRHCIFEESGMGRRGQGTAAAASKAAPPAASPSTAASGAGAGDFSSSSADDEEVVLRLLSLASLVVRCPAGALLGTEDVLGMFDTCLHVAHRTGTASNLLRSAAGDALSHIVLCIFGRAATGGGGDGSGASAAADERLGPSGGAPSVSEPIGDPLGSSVQAESGEGGAGVAVESSSPAAWGHRTDQYADAAVAIISRLAGLTNPQENPRSTCVLGLTLINLALETSNAVALASIHDLVAVVQDTLCRHLLQLSATSESSILSLTLRVIFNLFSSMKNHLKVQLEVFLTSVHLRILDPRSRSTPEHKEVVLESVLEFCHEPALMKDIYLNYDCDMQCTNLFETICKTLASVASPDAEDDTADTPSRPLNILNKLAVEGLLVIIESIAGRCQMHQNPMIPGDYLQGAEVSDRVEAQHFMGNDWGVYGSTASFSSSSPASGGGASDSQNSSGIHLRELHDVLARTESVLHERKRQKHRLATVTSEFNDRPMKKGWIEMGERLGLLPSPATSEAVAEFLYSTPKLNKTAVGEYISRGPADKYPFHAAVLKAFLQCFDFGGMYFSDALRTFLKKFRLPGEAQCIDRLMEAFAAQLHDQTKEDSQLPFKNADAAFILAFSTIMLNTDLHNPSLKDDRRMTIEQFIRNNRGINNGEDLPEDFLSNLYFQIKEDEIQVQKDLSDILRGGASASEGIAGRAEQWHLLRAKELEVAAPFFTPSHSARRAILEGGVHERDMFSSFASNAIKSTSSVFRCSWDDALVVKIMKGFKQMANIAIYFNIDNLFNKILLVLLTYGRDYVVNTAPFAYVEEELAKVDNEDDQGDYSDESSEEENADVNFGVDNLVSDGSSIERAYQHEYHASVTLSASASYLASDLLQGSATHRGLLSLDCGLSLVRAQPDRLRDAWPVLIRCIFALRDAKALRPQFADLDDFCDSRGVPLPQSPFALRSDMRIRRYFSSLYTLPQERNENEADSALTGFFSSFFQNSVQKEAASTSGSYDGFGFREESIANIILDSDRRSHRHAIDAPLSSFSEELLSVSEATDINDIIVRRRHPEAVSSLLEFMDCNQGLGDGLSTGGAEDPMFEHHAVFALELSFRYLISNRDKGAELFPSFMPRFERLLHAGEEADPVHPYLMERGVVTILRSCIHLWDIPEVSSYFILSINLCGKWCVICRTV